MAKATVGDVVFEDIGVADLAATRQDRVAPLLSGEQKLVRMVILADCWGVDRQRGHIRGIVIDGVTVDGQNLPPSEFYGVDAAHAVEGVVLRGIRLRGKANATGADLKIAKNDFVRDLTVCTP